MVEGARLESVCTGNGTVGSNPILSAILRSASYEWLGPVKRVEKARMSCVALAEHGLFGHENPGCSESLSRN